MKKFDMPFDEIHEDKEIFKTILLHTAQESGFLPELIEKDYYNSLILNKFYLQKYTKLVFKGGTCLSKVYMEFYRLSEDLDFVISCRSTTSRSQRSAKIRPIKDHFRNVVDSLKCFRFIQELEGYNESKQYIGKIAYPSIIGNKPGSIKIEISLREHLLQNTVWKDAFTLLIDPFKTRRVVSPFKIKCLNELELFAEKFRAALSRKEPVIRDFFDIFLAQKDLNLDFTSTKFINLVKAKLAIPGNDPIPIDDNRRKKLQNQIKTELKPVLRDHDYQKFDFDLVFSFVKKFAENNL